jgi:hypothetical protein
LIFKIILSIDICTKEQTADCVIISIFDFENSMSDDFMNNWVGAGTSTSIYPTLNLAAGVAICNYTDSPAVRVKTIKLTFDYEAWFTGDMDSASLASGIKNVGTKLLGYLASSAGLCDTLVCTANSNDCIDLFNKANIQGNILGISKTSVDTIQTQYLCEQPKPISQLPIFNRIACIPVNSTLSFIVPATFTDSEVQTFVSNSIQSAMASGDLNTNNEVVGLVYTGTPHTKMNSSGTIQKEMRPLGVGLLAAGSTTLFLLLVGLITKLILKKRRMQEEQDYDDLSIQKEGESISLPVDSFETAVLSPNSTRSYDMSAWKETSP